MPRRPVVLALAAVVIALAGAPPAVAQSTAVSGTFAGGLPRPEALASCPGIFCSSGTLDPFGEFTVVYAPLTFEPATRSCADVTAEMTLTFTASGDQLVLATTSSACWAGNSLNAPGSAHSWGNPATDSGTWTVASGTGAFADATGTGTYTAKVAGSAVRGSIDGTLN